MKEFLTFEKAQDQKMNMIDVVKYYFPKMSNEDADYMIWEETCYPMDTDRTFEQIYKIYKSRTKASSTKSAKPDTQPQ